VTHHAPGVSGARNAALRAARGAIIAWTDDDCMVDRRWMTTIWREFSEDPDLGVLGGYVAPFIGTVTAPFEPSAEGRMELVATGEMMFVNLTRIATCNAAFSRAARSRVGEFDEQLGTGTWAGSAEDWDYVYRAVRDGVRVVFCPQMVVYHHHGRSEEQQRSVNRNYAVGRGAFYCKHIVRGDLLALSVAWCELRVWTGNLWRHVVSVSTWISYLVLGAVHRAVRIP
jgi:GT2 family glycosyltransferase